ncbi:SusC/RagA family TonB-linked outer membrane protein [Rhodohalobacter sp. 614A]|uniref:SusC/RagA family TonB-linked outer membrane protein n=1 Tax=Rhodohalobacter sp. 614A TaxID=2908649 RepID=UPI001F2EC6DB|nr:TonB-dependent receptor [Rhodohalobacter sp. 614A]
MQILSYHNILIRKGGLLWGLLLCLLLVQPTWAQNTDSETVEGVVTDAETGESLPGVNIYLKDTTRGTSSDLEGRYSITVPSLNDTLVYSYVGYQIVEIPINGRSEINVELQSQAIEGDELVVIGYGTVARSDITGSVSSIDAEEVREIPTTNVMEALQGKVSGMDITRSSGESGSGVNITIRGNRSLTASNSPLVIVDGIQYGSLQDINPADIESIEVLKDASSTAIYGSRGANGVILISTKQANQAGTQVSVESYVGVSTTADYPDFNTGPQYVALKREANRVSGDWSGPEDDPNIFSTAEMQYIEDGVWTDFRDLLFKNGLQQSHQVNISKGSENTSVYLSLNYFDEKGILEMDHLQRYTARLNVEQEIGDVLNLGFNSQITYHDQDNRRDPTNIANKINPLTPAYDEEGNVIVRPHGGRDVSPLADLEPNAYKNNSLTTRIFPTVYALFTPSEAFSFRTNLSATLTNGRQGIYRASDTIDRNGAAPEAIYQSDNSRNVTFENIANYQTDIGDHGITLTGITSYLFNKNDFGSSLGRNQLLSSQLYYGLLNATEGIAVESGYEESSLMSFAGRVNYNFQDKYLLTLTGRYDGSSKLSEDNKWAFFPSAAFAWRLSQEDFFPESSIFNDVKLRVSYGVSGNDAIEPYSTQSVLRRIPFSYGEDAAAGFAFSTRLGNPNLEWELSKTANLGLDIGLFENRVTATIDLYDTRTSNLLLDRFLPLTSGVASVTQNVGKTRNRGIEFTLNTINTLSEDFSWNTDLTFFSNKEEIVELVSESDDIGNGWFIGEPTEVFYDYEKIGIWQQDEAAEAASYGQEPGEIKVKDQNGDGQITASEDRVILGSPRPKWSGGIENSFSYRGFDLSFYVYARVGQMMSYEYYNSYKPGGVENGAAVDYWTPDNPTNAFPKPNAALSRDNYQYYSTLSYVSGSYVKLRNATLGYTLPIDVMDRIPASRIRFYITGRNLLTFTKVDNYDPERGGSLTFPMTRLFVGGINIDF